MVREELIVISAVDDFDHYLIYDIRVCTWLCVWRCWILWHPPWFDFQMFSPFHAHSAGMCVSVCVEVCVYGYKFPSGPRLYRSCHITGTDDLQWRSERGCMHVMDHCSRTRRCRFPLFCFSFALRASWSEVVLRRFSTRTLGALKLDIPACFYVCFLTFGDRYSLHFYITA